MPANEMFPTDRILRSMTLTVEDLTVDLVAGVRLEVKIEFTDGMRATILSREMTDDVALAAGEDLPSLYNAFVFGEGAGDVLRWAQGVDRSAQSRRVRRSIG